MEVLKDLNCTPCPKGGQSLSLDEEKALLTQLSCGWRIVGEDQSAINARRLQLTLETQGLKEALEKACEIGKMADEQWHHPELMAAFKSLKVEIFTHDINGLRKSDFIFAAKVDSLLDLLPRP
jgi:4a-hydroxytetrahydrobiopterin dehydratase